MQTFAYKKVKISNKPIMNNNKFLSVLFLAPALLLIFAMTIIPIVIAFNTSLHETNYAQIGDFIGLKHYRDIFGSEAGWKSILNSFTYVLCSLIIVIPVGIVAAVLLNRKIKSRALLRTLIIIPWVLSQTVTALLWRWLLNSSFGPVSYIGYLLTGNKLDFFNTPIMAKLTVIFVNAWNSFPIVLILILASLQNIGREIFEAADVDGANRKTKFFRIILPLIKPTILTAIVLQSMEYFNMVTLIYVLTAGGPFGATQTVSVLAFMEGFDYWHMGFGSAASIVIFLMNMILSIIYIRILRSKD
jgi:multiple sugar transport system permease protein